MSTIFLVEVRSPFECKRASFTDRSVAVQQAENWGVEAKTIIEVVLNPDVDIQKSFVAEIREDGQEMFCYRVTPFSQDSPRHGCRFVGLGHSENEAILEARTKRDEAAL